MFSKVLREWMRKLKFVRPTRAAQRRSTIRLRVEPLEELVMLSVFPVTTTADSGDGSLRQAILAADGAMGTNTITFDIAGPGPYIIEPQSALPSITEPVIIDGTTQPGYVSSPLIQIDGSQAGMYVDGLRK